VPKKTVDEMLKELGKRWTEPQAKRLLVTTDWGHGNLSIGLMTLKELKEKKKQWPDVEFYTTQGKF